MLNIYGRCKHNSWVHTGEHYIWQQSAGLGGIGGKVLSLS